MKTQVEPTVKQMHEVADRMGVDRICLVRRPEGPSELGLAVLCIGIDAIETIGPTLADFSEKFGSYKVEPPPGLHADLSIDWVFNWMEKTGNRYLFAVCDTYDPNIPICFAAFLGMDTCEPLAGFLNAHGCVVNFE